jgi:hypothetical protein
MSVLLCDQTLDLTDAENAVLECTRTCFAWASEVTTVVSAVLVGNCVATTVVDHAHVDLLRVDVAGPEDLHGFINLLEIGVRFDLRAQSRNGGIPRAVKVVRQDGEPVSLSLKALDIHVLRVLVLRRNGDTETKAVTESLANVLEEFDLVGTVLGAAAAALMTRPLPVNIEAAELPLGDKLLQRVDECLAVLLCAHHVGKGSPRSARVGKLEAANADPLGNVVGQRHELLVDVFIIAVHHANLERLGVDGGEGEDEMGDASGVELAGPDFVTWATSSVPTSCERVVLQRC